jgi:pimeloyl-ACP methyl ester carboxylesterase
MAADPAGQVRVRRAQANGIELAYEEFGHPGGPPLLLIMGLGAQMITWPDDFCRALAVGRHVVRFDNRDVGESQWLEGEVDLAACMAGDTSSAVYTLEHMADDCAGLLDALGWESAHVVGASMGGMVAQTVAIRHPERIRSLTSIMSTTGERAVATPTQAATAALLSPPARTREEAMERAVSVGRVVGSPGLPRDEDDARRRAALAWDRGLNPAGFARQLAAIQASGDRTPALASVDVPTLVVHGEDDPLVPVAGGRATAAAITGADLWTVPGMGHDLPRAIWPDLIARIGVLVEGADLERAA